MEQVENKQETPQNLPSPNKQGLVKLNEKIEVFNKFVFNIAVIMAGVGAIIFGIYEYNQEHFIFEPFDVPESLSKKGYYGYVVTNQIVDKIEVMKSAANSFKEGATTLSNSASIPDVNFKVIGVGVSLQTTIEYIKTILGNPSRKITGEITLQDSSIALNLRMTGSKAVSFEKSIKGKTEKEVLDTLFLQASATILKASEPYILAAYCARIKEEEMSIRTIRYVLDNEPTTDDAWAYSLWGGLLVAAKDSLGAIDKFQKAIALQDNIPITYGNWASLHIQGKNNEEGIKLYQKTLEIEPNYLFAYVALGNIHRRQKEYDKATEMYQKALSIKSNYYNAHNAWGFLLREQEKYAESTEKYLYSLSIEPNQPSVYNNLAYSYYLQKKYKEGIAIAEEGLKLAPKNGYLYSTMAELYDGMGKQEEFYANVEKAMQNGWDFEKSLTNKPYSKYKDEAKFKELVEKYSR